VTLSFRASIRFAASVAVATAAVSSFAVVATTSTSSPGSPDSLFTFVGQMKGASAVAVGPNLVLTARHVGGGDFTLGGTTYTMLSSMNAPQYTIAPGNTTNVDLTLVKIDGTLPGWYDIALPGVPKAGDTITMVGYGGSGTVRNDGTGYDTGVAAGTRRAGDNTADDFGTIDVDSGVVGGGPVMISYLKGAGQAALGVGDSGGGWFENGKLVGISSFVFNDTDWSYKDNGGTHTGRGAPNYGFPRTTDIHYDSDGDGVLDKTLLAGTPYFGSGAISLTDPQIQTWLVSQGVTPVPEPGTLVFLSLGSVALLRRRRQG
jgi:hypothetical protein